MNQQIDWSAPQKLSPVSLVFVLGKILKESWLIILFLIGRQLFKDQDVAEAATNKSIYYFLGLTGALLLIHIRHFIEFFRYRYYIEGNELIVLSGVFSKVKTSIPINRIQSVHLIQTYLHQFTNTCELKLETAGSDKTEIEFKAIKRDLALALQAFLNDKTNVSAEKEMAVPVQLMGLQSMDLVKLALSENHIKTLLIIVGFAIARMDDLRQFFGFDAESLIDQQVDQSNFGMSLLLQLSIVVLLITLSASFIRVIIRFANMQLKSTEKGFQMQWGFIQTQQKMLLQNKVQLISWSSNFVRRLLGIQMLRFYMTGEDLVKTDQHIQLPVMQPNLLRQLTAAYQMHWPQDNASSNGVNHAYGWRPTVLYILPLSMIASIGLYFLNPWFMICPFIFLMYMAISNWIRFKQYKFWYTTHAIQIQKGIWGREYSLLNFEMVQHVVVKSTPYQRAKGLATIVFHTAGTPLTIPYLPIDQANFLADFCLVKIEFRG